MKKLLIFILKILYQRSIFTLNPYKNTVNFQDDIKKDVCKIKKNIRFNYINSNF